MHISTLLATAAVVVGVSASPLIQHSAPSPRDVPPTTPVKHPHVISFAEALRMSKLPAPSASSPRLMNLMAARPIQAQGPCSQQKVRRDWNAMSGDQRNRFLDAIAKLQSLPRRSDNPDWAAATNLYEELVLLHQYFTPAIHSTDVFLVWHRAYVHILEDLLEQNTDYKEGIPYWNEARTRGNSLVNEMVFRDDAFGNLPSFPDFHTACLTSGKFSAKQLHIGPGDYPNNGPHCLYRGLDTTYASDMEPGYVKLVTNYDSFHQMAFYLERGPHAIGHQTVGGVMNDLSAAPSDPLFWLHHSYIDRVYSKWQKNRADKGQSIGIEGATGTVGGPPLTTDTMMDFDQFGMVAVRDSIDANQAPLCYRYDNFDYTE